MKRFLTILFVVTLLGLYFALLWRLSDIAHIGISILFLLAIAQVKHEHEEMPARKMIPAEVMIGGFLLGLVATTLVYLIAETSFVHDPGQARYASTLTRIAPLVAGFGSAIRFHGFAGPKRFYRELTLLFFLGVPTLVASSLFDISPITARYSEIALRLYGADVRRDNLMLTLPGGSIRVYEGCSGIESMGYLLGLSIICLIVFPTSKYHYLWLPFLATMIGFAVNGIRVALLTVFAANRKAEAFDYWHDGEGSLLFGGIAAFVLGAIYCLLLLYAQRTRGRARHGDTDALVAS